MENIDELNKEYFESGRWKCKPSPTGAHHWNIRDDKKYHQIGICQYCEEQKDYGINPTIVTDRWLVTTDYALDSFTGKLKKKTKIEEREWRGYKLPIVSGRYVRLRDVFESVEAGELEIIR